MQEHTAEVVEKNKEISRQKAEQLSTQFNQKLAEAEFKALKAQMNPHFIFNCLNSIKNLIQEEDQKKKLFFHRSLINRVEAYHVSSTHTLHNGLIELTSDALQRSL